MEKYKTHLHEHCHRHRQTPRNRLKIAIIVTSVVMILEIAGSLFSNSLALLSDAAHMFSHVLALGISFLAVNIAMRPATKEKTYGFFRAEVLAAFANGIILLFVAGFIFYHALRRIAEPQAVATTQMFLIALIGLVCNIATVIILAHPGKKDINLRSALLHEVGDAVSSLAVVGGAVFIYFTGNFIVDPILSFLIAILIVIWAVRLLIESGNILIESVPAHLDIDDISREIVGNINEIKRIEHIHIWELTSHMYAMTAHAVVDDCSVSSTHKIRGKLDKLVKDKYNIFHLNVQFECAVKDE